MSLVCNNCGGEWTSSSYMQRTGVHICCDCRVKEFEEFCLAEEVSVSTPRHNHHRWKKDHLLYFDDEQRQEDEEEERRKKYRELNFHYHSKTRYLIRPLEDFL
mgnify:CR=1 FL=1